MKCLSPIKKEYKEYKRDNKGKIHEFTRYITVGCGKCLACQSQKSTEWSMRCLHESIYYDYGRNAMFITLTYDNEYLPDNYSLDVRDLQLFFKRLRRRLDKKEFNGLKIKYFACGEYGTRRGRPHYHAIIFGLKYNNEIHKKLISDCWQKGFSYIGNVTDASVKYVAKYLSKAEQMFYNKKDYFNMTGRVRPFRLVSQGIGKRWLLDNYKNFIANDFRIKFDNGDCSVPRSYLRWLYKLNIVPDIHEKLKQFSQLRFVKILEELCHKGKILFEDVMYNMRHMPEDFRYSLEYYPDFYQVYKKDLYDRKYIYDNRKQEYKLKLQYSNRYLPAGVA